MDHGDRVKQPDRSAKKVEQAEVIRHYLEIGSLAETGRVLGISRERVRQLVNRAGISTARNAQSKVKQPSRWCCECGVPLYSPYAWYCETHRKEKHKRRYRVVKTDPEKYARWREQLKQYKKRRKGRQE
jgi:DNA-binding CsgD family transcriptional regulator